MEVYKEVWNKYEAEKHLITAVNIVEMKFEEFEKPPPDIHKTHIDRALARRV